MYFVVWQHFKFDSQRLHCGLFGRSSLQPYPRFFDIEVNYQTGPKSSMLAMPPSLPLFSKVQSLGHVLGGENNALPNCLTPSPRLGVDLHAVETHQLEKVLAEAI